jgi:hypothetical protein
VKVSFFSFQPDPEKESIHRAKDIDAKIGAPNDAYLRLKMTTKDMVYRCSLLTCQIHKILTSKTIQV